MANVRKYSDEERKQRQKEAQKKYRNSKKEQGQRAQQCISITLPPDEHARQLALIVANGYTNPPTFWRHCIRLLEAGQLPPKPTDTDTGKPSQPQRNAEAAKPIQAKQTENPRARSVRHSSGTNDSRADRPAPPKD